LKTVKEVSSLTGISVRTLHHYHAIGLLVPTQITEAGYRLYGEEALERLQTVLLLRELHFPLKEIREILDTPGFDPCQALEQQIRLLELQREHLDRLIAHARQLQKTGGIHMDFTPFDTTQMDQYAAEVKEKWGKTQAYREFREKTAGQSPEATISAGDGLMAIFTQLGQLRQLPAESKEVQALIARLQKYITDHYYTCTRQILRGLGQLYIAGDSMTENIDRAGGPGTAAFAHRAIEIYCKE